MLHLNCNNEDFGVAFGCLVVEIDCDSDEAGSDVENEIENVLCNMRATANTHEWDGESDLRGSINKRERTLELIHQ
jgi:hypothetical protein